MKIIRTSEAKWLQAVAAAYKSKNAIQIIDDANCGVNPAEDTIFAMGRKASLSVNEWSAVAVSIGVGATGVFLLVTAALDPEPFSKIAFVLGAGTILTFGGGGMAYITLMKQKPPNVRVINGGFEIAWN